MPSLEIERSLADELNITLIAGIDEAGRGAIAGPVVAAAVILPLNDPESLLKLQGVDDSKRLSARKREDLFDVIKSAAMTYGIASRPASDIDEIGLLPANAQAMSAAVAQLEPAPHFLLLDGRMRLKNDPTPQRSVIRGDSISLTIAAASILAKVTRDQIMQAFDSDYPGYHFGRHKGYCTSGHVAALSKYGPCQIHRRSFAPIRRTLL